MTVESKNVLKVPEEFKKTLTDSYLTIDETRNFLKKVYQDNETPLRSELPALCKKLVLENFQIKKQSDAFYRELKNHHSKSISERTRQINESLGQDETRAKLQQSIQELNQLLQESMRAIEQVPELDLKYMQDISDFDKEDFQLLYSRDEVLDKISQLDTKISDTEYQDAFKEDVVKLQELIQQEKLSRFKLYILNKSLYTNRYKKLKELDVKWSSRMDLVIKMEQEIAAFGEDLVRIRGDVAEKEEDDNILAGMNDNEVSDEEEEEVEDENEVENEIENEAENEVENEENEVENEAENVEDVEDIDNVEADQDDHEDIEMNEVSPELEVPLTKKRSLELDDEVSKKLKLDEEEVPMEADEDEEDLGELEK